MTSLLLTFVLGQRLVPAAPFPPTALEAIAVTSGPALACSPSACTVMWADSRFGFGDPLRSTVWLAQYDPAQSTLRPPRAVTLDAGSFPDLALARSSFGVAGLLSRNGTPASLAFARAPISTTTHLATSLVGLQPNTFIPGTACLAAEGQAAFVAANGTLGAYSVFAGPANLTPGQALLFNPAPAAGRMNCASAPAGAPFTLGYATIPGALVLQDFSAGGAPLVNTQPSPFTSVSEVIPLTGAPRQLMVTTMGPNANLWRASPDWSTTNVFSNSSTERLATLVSGGVGVVALVGAGPLLVAFASDGGGPSNLSTVGRTTALAEVVPFDLLGATRGAVETELRRFGITVQASGVPVLVPESTGTRLGAPAPRRAPAVVWDRAANSFLVAWDERVNGAYETEFGLLGRNGMLGPAPLRSLAVGRDGGDVRFFEMLDGRIAARFTGGAGQGQLAVPFASPPTAFGFERWADGRVTDLAWNVEPFTALAGGMTTPALEAGPQCVALLGGAFQAIGFNGMGQAVLRSFPDAVPSASSTRLVGVNDVAGPEASLSACTVVFPFDQRDLLLAVYPSLGGVKALQLALSEDAGLVTTLDPLVGQTVKGPVLATGLGDDLLVVYPFGREGREGISLAGKVVETGGQLTTLSFTQDEVGLRNVRVASSPDGYAAVVWQSFDLDAGAWVVQARVVEPRDAGRSDGGVFDAGDPGAVPDAAVLDASVVTDGGVLDASVVTELDAGRPDASVATDGGAVVDSGVRDGGARDAGPSDAGQPDASVTDAGGATDAADAGRDEVVFMAAGCGCSQGAWPHALALALLAVLRRARRSGQALRR
jgi:hypothetical protein